LKSRNEKIVKRTRQEGSDDSSGSHAQATPETVVEQNREQGTNLPSARANGIGKASRTTSIKNRVPVADVNLQVSLSALNERMKKTEEKLALLHENIIELLAGRSAVKATQGWYYDARYSADIANLYHPEFWDEFVKRWVGPNPALEISYVFEQSKKYRIEIKIYDFITDEVKNSFRVEVSGNHMPWESSADLVYVTTFTSKNTESLKVRFSVTESKMPSELVVGANDNRMIAFSFGYISIKRVDE
jgi:hypothetical protein